jgi:hypothetical protein
MDSLPFFKGIFIWEMYHGWMNKKPVSVHVVINNKKSDERLKEKIRQLEKKYDEQFKITFGVLHKLMSMPMKNLKLPIGFRTEP